MCTILIHPFALTHHPTHPIQSCFIHLTIYAHPMCILLNHPFTLTHPTHPIRSVLTISPYPLILCVSFSSIHLPWPIIPPIPSNLFHLSHHIHSSHVYPSHLSIILTHHPTHPIQSVSSVSPYPLIPCVSFSSIHDPDPSCHPAVPSHPPVQLSVSEVCAVHRSLWIAYSRFSLLVIKKAKVFLAM